MKMDKEVMDKEAITILTSEPCVSWLRERWKARGPQEGDLYSAPGWNRRQQKTVLDGAAFSLLIDQYYWLPRVGDFLDLLIQAGAYWCCIETDMIEIDKTGGNVKDQRYCVEIWVFCNGTDTERDFRSKDKLLACAQALEWLLGQREK